MEFAKIEIKTDNIEFSICLKHNINFLVGDSATNKTHLINKIQDIKRNKNIGEIISNFPILVINETSWETLEDSWSLPKRIYVLDEDFSYINNPNFKQFLYKSGSYFLIISREELVLNAPIDIHAVYRFTKIKDNGKTFIESEEAFKDLIDSRYKGYKLYTEDTKSGKSLCEISGFKVERGLGGAGKVKRLIRNTKEPVSLFVDLVAFANFAPYIDKYKEIIGINLLDCKSTEYVLLHNKELGIDANELEPGKVNWDFKRHKSLERVYTRILMDKSKDILGIEYGKGTDINYLVDSYVMQKMSEIFKDKKKSKLIDNF